MLSEAGAIEMRKVAFKWDGSQSLKSVLSVPFYKVSMRQSAEHAVPPHSVTLWRVDGTWLEIYSTMYAISDRSEVGVLAFEMVAEPSNESVVVDMQPPFIPAEIKKFLIKDEDVLAESGIKLSTAQDKVISVLAADFPCTVAVGGVGNDIPHVFDTAYEIDKYEVVPFY